jgi:hypothetical protein
MRSILVKVIFIATMGDRSQQTDPYRYESESGLQVSQEEVHERDLRRRRENVQVLIALGIIGGYITFAASDRSLFSTSLNQLGVQFLVSISGFFLFAKMIAITFRPDINNRWIDFVDERVAPGLYMLSVLGLTILVGVNYISSKLPGIPEEAISFAQTILFVTLFLGVVYWLVRTQFYNTAKSEEKLAADLSKTLSLLRNKEEIDESRENAMIRRFDSLLRTQEDLDDIRLYLHMFNDSDVFALNRDDRQRIFTLLNKIKIKLDEQRPVGEDIDKLESFLEEIEDR